MIESSSGSEGHVVRKSGRNTPNSFPRKFAQTFLEKAYDGGPDWASESLPTGRPKRTSNPEE